MDEFNRQSPSSEHSVELSHARSMDSLLDDQSECWRRGAGQPVETYLALHPELAGETEKLLDLICHEVLLRAQQGESPARDDYQRRFPRLAGQVRALFDVHQAMALGGSSRPGSTGPSVQSEATSLPRVVAGYELLEELGRGGMGVVYKARHARLNRLAALKMIHTGPEAGAEQKTRFRREAEALAQLEHPNIIRIYDMGESDGHPFLAMEFLTGGSLEERLRDAPLPPREAAALIETLARAVQHAHEHGIIHRDLKPSNILLVWNREQETGESTDGDD